MSSAGENNYPPQSTSSSWTTQFESGYKSSI